MKVWSVELIVMESLSGFLDCHLRWLSGLLRVPFPRLFILDKRSCRLWVRVCLEVRLTGKRLVRGSVETAHIQVTPPPHTGSVHCNLWHTYDSGPVRSQSLGPTLLHVSCLWHYCALSLSSCSGCPSTLIGKQQQ